MYRIPDRVSRRVRHRFRPVRARLRREPSSTSVSSSRVWFLFALGPRVEPLRQSAERASMAGSRRRRGPRRSLCRTGTKPMPERRRATALIDTYWRRFRSQYARRAMRGGVTGRTRVLEFIVRNWSPVPPGREGSFAPRRRSSIQISCRPAIDRSPAAPPCWGEWRAAGRTSRCAAAAVSARRPEGTGLPAAGVELQQAPAAAPTLSGGNASRRCVSVNLGRPLRLTTTSPRPPLPASRGLLSSRTLTPGQRLRQTPN